MIDIVDLKLINATLNDLDRLKEYKACSIFEYSHNLRNDEIEKIKEYIDIETIKYLDNYKNIIYQDKIIGSYLVRSIEDGILLDEIFVEEEYRGKGIGTLIIQYIILNSNDDLYLWVYKENTMAIKLYQKLGFVKKDETNSRLYMVKYN